MYSSSCLKLFQHQVAFLATPSVNSSEVLRDPEKERRKKGNGEFGSRALGLDLEDLGSNPQLSTN